MSSALAPLANRRWVCPGGILVTQTQIAYGHGSCTVQAMHFVVIYRIMIPMEINTY